MLSYLRYIFLLISAFFHFAQQKKVKTSEKRWRKFDRTRTSRIEMLQRRHVLVSYLLCGAFFEQILGFVSLAVSGKLKGRINFLFFSWISLSFLFFWKFHAVALLTSMNIEQPEFKFRKIQHFGHFLYLKPSLLKRWLSLCRQQPFTFSPPTQQNRKANP